MADAHVFIVGEIDGEPPGDLLWAPRARPAPILTMGLVPAFPGRPRAGRDGPVGTLQLAAQPLLNVLLQPRVRRPASPPWVAGPRSAPSTARPTPGSRASRRGSPRCAAAPARSSPGSRFSSRAIARTPWPCARSSASLLTLGERQIAAGRLGQAQWRHAASVTKPARPDWLPTRRPRPPRPRCACPARSDARTRAPHARPGSADPVNASPDEAPDPPAADVVPSHTSVIVRCCDDRLNPP